MSVNIPFPFQAAILNYHTGESFYLRSADESLAENLALFARITELCNQPTIYRFLFERRLGGQPYPVENAKRFIRWAKDGWARQAWFVFVIVDQRSQVVGAIDIRGNNANGAEIGYWLSATSSGLMTNAVLQLAQIGRRAGFKRLFAFVAPENRKSAAVLERAGFANVGISIKDDRQLIQYELVLDAT